MRFIVTPLMILGVSTLIQITFISRISLLSGNADVIMLVIIALALQEQVRYSWIWGITAGLIVGSISAAPWYIFIIVYLAVVGLARLIARRIWQAPLLAMFLVLFIGSLLMNLFIYLYRYLFESITVSLQDVFITIIIPSMLLNILLAVIIHPLIRDIAKLIYPAKEAE